VIMEDESYGPMVKQFLEALSDLMAEKYFERIDQRLKRIPELRRLVTAKEAGQYLSLSTDTVYRMAGLKKIPYLKIGDRVLFDLKALDHWIEKHMIKEKEWKGQELRLESEKVSADAKASKESDLLGLLRRKGKEKGLTG
jgi:excisionase family DNA binding protein